MLKNLVVASFLIICAVMMVHAFGEDRNYIQNLKQQNHKIEFSSPSLAIDGLVQHLGLVFKGLPSDKVVSVSSLDLFERPIVGVVMIPTKSSEVNDVIVKKVESLFGKEAVTTVPSLKNVDFSSKTSGIVVVTNVENVESELRMIPERSDVVLLNLEKNLEVMTPTQRKLMSVYLNNNNTNTNTSNSTISDAERADYQMQLWVWVIGIVCVILAVWAVTLIDYSGDQMLYALEMTKGHHD
ncbi:hypothetical protein C9374_012173 [Naegleria lovaniensis]|uniref:Uncharacterized protein n=1 Tax=Naegleria lovaniensis TaxID=51637 RepID=A0AA88GDB7_NAELO|nr:uncharacterized protein C9374_013080 [Naegleria lovaniensis]XP_044542608.1 uncharacterized protein C9374_012173 [Naegleria lovaniensis]KAG2372873.1 hypothetical protein C9374_013080 [Naegleria lovaniensis]KAG2373434.1 hypothetical protein C9374_012173 [Naegleria lovaniensis]